MPDALTMNSGDDSLSGSRVPAAISAACFALSRRTNSLNATHRSAFVRTLVGCHTEWPVIEVPVVVRGDISARTLCSWKPAKVSAAPGVGHKDRELSTH